MHDPTKPRHTPVLSFIVASLVTFVIAAPTTTWSQAPPPQVAPKSVIIQVAPAPEPVIPPAVPPAPPVAPVPAPLPPPENPGLINEIGKLFKNSTSILPEMPALPSFKSFGDSTDGLTRLNTIAKGRVACPVAANGAPDCKSASDRLCQSKGFKEGKSLDTDAAQSCSAKSMLPGRRPEPGDCKTENYVTQALCQ
jgi:hypothetical protein